VWMRGAMIETILGRRVQRGSGLADALRQ